MTRVIDINGTRVSTSDLPYPYNQAQELWHVAAEVHDICGEAQEMVGPSGVPRWDRLIRHVKDVMDDKRATEYEPYASAHEMAKLLRTAVSVLNGDMDSPEDLADLKVRAKALAKRLEGV